MVGISELLASLVERGMVKRIEERGMVMRMEKDTSEGWGKGQKRWLRKSIGREGWGRGWTRELLNTCSDGSKYIARVLAIYSYCYMRLGWRPSPVPSGCYLW